MHDELFCDADLPDTDVPAGACFRTKAFPGSFLYRYRITKAGRLIDALDRDLECSGYVQFHYYLHRSALCVRSAEYRAHFCDGQLKSIVRVKEKTEGADVWVVYGLASFRFFALAAPSRFMSEANEAAETSQSHAEKFLIHPDFVKDAKVEWPDVDLD